MLQAIKAFVPSDVATIVFKYAESVAIACVGRSKGQFEVCYYRPSQRQWLQGHLYTLPPTACFYRHYMYIPKFVQNQVISYINVWSNIIYNLPVSPVTDPRAALTFMEFTVVLLSPATRSIYKLSKNKWVVCGECPISTIRRLTHVDRIIYFTDTLDGVWRFTLNRFNYSGSQWHFTFKKLLFIPFAHQDITSIRFFPCDRHLMAVVGCYEGEYVDRLTSGLQWDILQELDDWTIKSVCGFNDEVIFMTDLGCQINRLSDGFCCLADSTVVHRRPIYSLTPV